MNRLFVATWPPEHVVQRLSELQGAPQPGIRWTTPDQWHVTLQFIGDADESVVRSVLNGLEASQCEISLGPATARFSGSVVHLPVRGADDLAAAVERSLAAIGLQRDKPFRGHLTLARARRGADLRPFTGMLFEAAWTATDVTLVASRTESEGAKYSVLDRFPL